LDFADFCRVVDLMAKKAHLTQEGLNQILFIKSGMNTARDNLTSLCEKDLDSDIPC
jgi:hypothetical protein